MRDKEFIAYSKKLLRVLRKISDLLYKINCECPELNEVKDLVDDLIQDTETDIYA